MKLYKMLGLVALFVVFTAMSCNKNDDYPTDSIEGPWQLVYQESGAPSAAPYIITIDADGGAGSDTYSIYNFDNSGSVNPLGVQVLKSDTVLTIISPGYSGNGAVERNYSAIYWSYTGSSGFVRSKFKRP
ncbi:MAG: hypothetical protein JW783_01070 [Bacteroidales bacterium]|nr:hypothetical protein [Bacteroidales bacterium]MBN2748239.1 hypothetical protein [Bacteroidales bacterium]